eukprot:3553350-Pyramimonas_sp.AAC.1
MPKPEFRPRAASKSGRSETSKPKPSDKSAPKGAKTAAPFGSAGLHLLCGRRLGHRGPLDGALLL